MCKPYLGKQQQVQLQVNIPVTAAACARQAGTRASTTASAAEVSPTAKADWLESLLHPRRHMMQDRKREKAILHLIKAII